MKISSSAVHIVNVLAVGGRGGGILAKAAIGTKRGGEGWGGRDESATFRGRQHGGDDLNINHAALEGQKRERMEEVYKEGGFEGGDNNSIAFSRAQGRKNAKAKVAVGAPASVILKGVKGNKGAEPTMVTVGPPAVILDLTMPPLEMTVDVDDGLGEIDEAALKAFTEGYVLETLKTVLPGTNMKNITVTITAVPYARRSSMTTTRTLATVKYIIDITVEYEQMSAPTAIEEDLNAVVSAAFKGCGFLTAVQEDESIGATVKERVVVAAPIKETMKEAFNLKSTEK